MPTTSNGRSAGAPDVPDAPTLDLAPLAHGATEDSLKPEFEINLDSRLRPDIELNDSSEQVLPSATTTLREAAVLSVTEPDHDSAMPEPSNQIEQETP